MRSLDSLFRAEPSRGRAGSAVALAGAVRQVVALTGEWMGWDDDWYNSADEPILWLLESQGITPTAELRQSVSAALSAFNSWTEPTPARRRAVADEIAFAALREELNQALRHRLSRLTPPGRRRQRRPDLRQRPRHRAEVRRHHRLDRPDQAHPAVVQPHAAVAHLLQRAAGRG